jgi:putative Mg2+ transporter-C (MgtC) family protein
MELENRLRGMKLKYKRMLIVRKDNLIEVNYVVRGRRENMEALDLYLLNNHNIWQYQVQNNPL